MNITFSAHLRAIAAKSAIPSIRESETIINEYFLAHDDGQIQYGWLGLTDDVYADTARANANVESLNALYWNDFARSLEAYLVVTKWRALELVRGAVEAITRQQVLTPAILSRSLLELVAQAIVTVGPISGIVERAASEWDQKVMMSGDLENLVGRGLFGSRQVDQSHPHRQTNILTLIQKLSQQPDWQMLEEVYARLCEVAHPNKMGNARFWTSTVRGEPGSSYVRMLYRDQVSGDTVEPILTDALWSLAWGAQNIHICIMKGKAEIAFIMQRFPHDPARAA